MAMRRGVAFVLALIGLAIFISMMGLAATYFFLSREPSVETNSTLMLRIQGGLVERQPLGGLGPFFGSQQTVRSVVDSLRKAKVDPRISGVILAPSGPQTLWGKLQEIRDAVTDFRESGKPIVTYLEYGGEQEYYLATASDRIFLMPTSPLDLTGVATYELFLRGLLDKIGAYPDMLHAGKYKTAANQYTEETFTAAHREMSESLNLDMYEQLIGGIADGREMPYVDVLALLNEGPLLPPDAVRVGLVDALAYEDEIRDRAPFADADGQELDDSDYRQVSLSSLVLNRGQKIAVVYAVGVIVSGSSGFDVTGSQVIGSQTLIESIRAARDDGAVRAIVLRIDSPGGGAFASDVIWRELMLAREEKPLIASMSDLAASGGYYIALPAHAIVAQPATLTGSIGVVMGKVIFGGTYEKLGINIESTSNGRYAEIYSPVRPFSDEERAKVEEQMLAFYDQFVGKVAEARQTTPERIDEVAQGRVWTGRQARRVGLVDDLGGLDRALALAKQRANIPLDEEVQLVVYPRRKGLFELISDSFTVRGMARVPLLRRPEEQALSVLTAPLRLFRRGEPLALMPYVFLR